MTTFTLIKQFAAGLSHWTVPNGVSGPLLIVCYGGSGGGGGGGCAFLGGGGGGANVTFRQYSTYNIGDTWTIYSGTKGIAGVSGGIGMSPGTVGGNGQGTWVALGNYTTNPPASYLITGAPGSQGGGNVGVSSDSGGHALGGANSATTWCGQSQYCIGAPHDWIASCSGLQGQNAVSDTSTSYIRWSEDDGYYTSTSFNNNSNLLTLDATSSSTSYVFLRFSGLVIPKGASITSANLTINFFNVPGTVRISIKGDKEASPGPINSANPNIPLTSYTVTFNANVGNNTLDVSGIISEILNTYVQDTYSFQFIIYQIPNLSSQLFTNVTMTSWDKDMADAVTTAGTNPISSKLVIVFTVPQNNSGPQGGMGGLAGSFNPALDSIKTYLKGGDGAVYGCINDGKDGADGVVLVYGLYNPPVSINKQFHGPLKDFRIYKKALSLKDIFEINRFPENLYTQPSLFGKYTAIPQGGGGGGGGGGLNIFGTPNYPCLEDRMFALDWVPGINNFNSQSEGIVCAFPMWEHDGKTIYDVFGRHKGTITGTGSVTKTYGGILASAYNNPNNTSYITIPSGAPVNWTLVQHLSNTNQTNITGGTTQGTITQAATITTGNAVFVVVTANNNIGDIGTTITVSDTLTNTWTALNSFTTFGTESATQTYYCLSVTGGSTTITAVNSGLTHASSSKDSMSIVVIEVSGITGIEDYKIDTGTTAGSGTTNIPATACNVTGVNNLYLSFLGLDNVGPFTYNVDNGYVLDINGAGNSTNLISNAVHQNVSNSTLNKLFAFPGAPNWTTTAVSTGYAVTSISLKSVSSGSYDLNLARLSNGFTVTFWFSGPSSSITDENMIASTYPLTNGLNTFWGSSNQPLLGWQIYLTVQSGALYMNMDFSDAFYNTSGVGSAHTSTISSMVDTGNYTGRFYHAAIAFRPGSSGGVEAAIYINGQTKGYFYTPLSSISTLYSGSDITLCGYKTYDGSLKSTQAYLGQLKDFRIYKTALLPGIISSIFTQPNELYRQPSLIPYYSVQIIYTGHGAIRVGGTAKTIEKFKYIGSGTLRLSGTNLSGKTKVYTGSGTLHLHSFPTFQSGITDTTPLVWHRLDEANGPIAHNVGALPNSDGTYYGNVSYHQPSLIPSDPDYSVGLANNAYVARTSIGNATPLSPYYRTIMMWFKTSNDVVTRQLLYTEGDLSTGFGIYIFSNKIAVIAWNFVNGTLPAFGKHYVISNTIIKPYSTYSVVLSFDGVNSTLSGFINGNLFGTVSW